MIKIYTIFNCFIVLAISLGRKTKTLLCTSIGNITMSKKLNEAMKAEKLAEITINGLDDGNECKYNDGLRYDKKSESSSIQKTCEEGEKVELKCPPCNIGSPESTIEWLKDNLPYNKWNKTNGVELSDNKYTLKIKECDKLDEGDYNCKVYNAKKTSNIPYISRKYKVTVKRRYLIEQFITEKPQSETVEVGGSYIFKCPIPESTFNVEYYRKVNSKTISISDLQTNHSRVEDEYGSPVEELKISNVSSDDAVWYSCLVRSEDGRYANASAYLNVVYPDRWYVKYQTVLIEIGIVVLLCLGAAIILICISYRFKKKEEMLEMELATATVLTQCIIKKIIIEKHINKGNNAMDVPTVRIEERTVTRETMNDYLETHGARKGSFSTVVYEIPADEDFEFPLDDLEMGEIIGSGEFGQVFKAKAHGILQANVTTIVAVKTLKADHTDADLEDLITEMEIMKLIGKHENILQLLGSCTVGGVVRVITEYAANGNLQNYLRTYSNPTISLESSYAKCKISEDRLIRFAYEIAQGMEYLASKKCIHRDLAARNILVTEDFRMKISDFGLARDIGGKEYYKKTVDSKLPLKWMAPESLFHKRYTVKSDVWSFGILMWEIMTMGGSPYPSIDSQNNLFQYIREGHRMERPPDCSLEAYDIMCDCWKYDPIDRPDFSDIVKMLHSLLTKSEKTLYPNTYNLSCFSGYSISSDTSEDENDNLLVFHNDVSFKATPSLTGTNFWNEEQMQNISSGTITKRI